MISWKYDKYAPEYVVNSYYDEPYPSHLEPGRLDELLLGEVLLRLLILQVLVSGGLATLVFGFLVIIFATQYLVQSCRANNRKLLTLRLF